MDELVSIVVVTYNSGKYIVETLKSIIDQSYKNIEVVITDDCSKDNTVKLSEEFFKNNNFEKYKIITAKDNTGIPGNVNRGIKAAEGRYIKVVAGDDILLPDCIEDNVLFMKSNNNLMQFSDMRSFRVDDNGIKVEVKNFRLDEKYDNEDVKKQFRLISYRNFVHAPTAFYDRNIFDRYGFFNEKFKFMDDYPMWIKLSEQGVAIYYLKKDTILYRQHSNSLSNSNEVNAKYMKCFKEFYDNELKFILLKHKKFFSLMHHKVRILKDEVKIKNNSNDLWYLKLYNFLDPIFMCKKIKTIFIRE